MVVASRNECYLNLMVSNYYVYRNDYVRSHIPESVNADTFTTFLISILLLRLFLVHAIPCLKLKVAAALELGGGRSPVPPAITPNHGPPNRLL